MKLMTRGILLCVTGLGLFITFFTLAFFSFQDREKIQSALNTSYALENIIFQNQNKNSNNWDENFKSAVALLEPDFRRKAFQDYTAKSNSANLSYILKTEEQFRKFTAEKLVFINKRLIFFAGTGFTCAVTLCLLLLSFIAKQVFSPVRDLSRKMTDFLNQKYSYQFTVPPNHEIGDLQSTFNAMAQKVLRQIDDLKSLDKAKSEFLSIASHELRTPLTSIRGSLGLMQGGIVGPMNDAAKNLMQIALNETDRLVRIINELLDLAKIEAKQFPLKTEWVNAEKFAIKTLESLRGFADAAHVKVEIGDFTNVEILIDPDRMQQVLTNLLSNAIKFSPKDKSVLLHFRKIDTGFQFEVADSGRGISPEDQELIFEKFRQATSPMNPLVKGTGLGLTIAKALVEQHGGVIGVKSRPGEGSTFFFTIIQFRQIQQQEAS
jgi:signal transduction histidine kinase